MNAMPTRTRALALVVALAGAAQGCLSRYEIGEAGAPAPDESAPDAPVVGPDESAPDVVVPPIDESPGPDAMPPGPDVVNPPPDVPVIGPDAGPMGLPPFTCPPPSSQVDCYDFEPMGRRPPEPGITSGDRGTLGYVPAMGSTWLRATTLDMAPPVPGFSAYYRTPTPPPPPGLAMVRYEMRFRVRAVRLPRVPDMTPVGQTMTCLGSMGMNEGARGQHNYALCLSQRGFQMFDIPSAAASMMPGEPIALGDLSPGVPMADQVFDVSVEYLSGRIAATVRLYSAAGALTDMRTLTVTTPPYQRAVFNNSATPRSWTIGTLTFGPSAVTEFHFDIAYILSSTP